MDSAIAYNMEIERLRDELFEQAEHEGLTASELRRQLKKLKSEKRQQPRMMIPGKRR